MNLALAVFCKKGLSQFGLVAADVVAGHVDLSLGGLTGEHALQEGNELPARMTSGCPAEDVGGCSVQCGKQAQGANTRIYTKQGLVAAGRN